MMACTKLSEFIETMCRIRPQPLINIWSGLTQFFRQYYVNGNDVTHHIVRTVSGSLSEFYIEPMLPCVGDIDILTCLTEDIAVPKGYPLDRFVRLPVEFHMCNEINVLEFTDWMVVETDPSMNNFEHKEFPGYVVTRCTGKLTKLGSTGDYYIFERTETMNIVTAIIPPGIARHGPADTEEGASLSRGMIDGRLHEIRLDADHVRCIRCLQWPPQADEWHKRRREYDCPDTATVERIVSNGCDLVFTAHHKWKYIESWNNRMLRISFSRAETVLLNSWTAKQQIMYHLLRYVVNKKGFKASSSEDSTKQSESQLMRQGIFCNYHLKTLMLWSVEHLPQQWWTHSVEDLLTKLFQFLAKLMSKRECLNYFIVRCNLFEHLDFHSDAVKLVYESLKSETVDRLFIWLVNNYVRQCADCDDIPRFIYDGVYRQPKDLQLLALLSSMSSMVKWRKDESITRSMYDLTGLLKGIDEDFCLPTVNYVNIHIVCRQFVEAYKACRQLVDFFVAIIFLHFTELMKPGNYTFQIMNTIQELMERDEPTVSVSSFESTPFEKATHLMLNLKPREAVANTDTILQVELAKAFLHLSTNNSIDFYQVDVQRVVRCYLASLYIHTQQYQTALDQCLSVMKPSQTQCNSPVVEGRLLAAIDDNVSSVSALIAIYQFLQNASLRNQLQQQTQEMTRVNSVFAANLFSYYCIAHCHHRIIETCTEEILHRYRRTLRQSPRLFIGDILLHSMSQMKSPSSSQIGRPSYCHHRSINTESATVTGKSVPFRTVRLRCLLIQNAVERLNASRQAMSRDFGSVFTCDDEEIHSIPTDYEAMYAYKCGDYERCFHLCEQNVENLLGASDVLESFTLPSSNLLLLMDDDFLSLVGLTVLVRGYSTECVTQTSLSLYLLAQSKLKMKHSAMSFVPVLDRIKCEYSTYPEDWIDRLILKFTYQKIQAAIKRF